MKVLGILIASVICGYAYGQVFENIIQGQLFYKSMTTTVIVHGAVFALIAAVSFIWSCKLQDE